jgi:hypothetical protein
VGNLPTKNERKLADATECRHDVRWGVIINLPKIGVDDPFVASSIMATVDAMNGVSARLSYGHLVVEVKGKTDKKSVETFASIKETLLHYMETKVSAPSPTT